ncbi:MAG: hypothetical protein ABIO44_06490, partial [Saprospiraceae bacterium]
AKNGTKYLFLAQWASKNLQYPIYSGQSLVSKSKTMEFTLNIVGKNQKIKVEFKPYQSVILEIAPNGKINFVDISFLPKTPIVRPKEVQRTYF